MSAGNDENDKDEKQEAEEIVKLVLPQGVEDEIHFDEDGAKREDACLRRNRKNNSLYKGTTITTAMFNDNDIIAQIIHPTRPWWRGRFCTNPDPALGAGSGWCGRVEHKAASGSRRRSRGRAKAARCRSTWPAVGPKVWGWKEGVEGGIMEGGSTVGGSLVGGSREEGRMEGGRMEEVWR